MHHMCTYCTFHTQTSCLCQIINVVTLLCVHVYMVAAALVTLLQFMI